MKNLNIQSLLDMAQECLEAREQVWFQRRRAASAPLSHNEEISYWQADAVDTSNHFALSRACEMIDVNPDAVLTLQKAFNRHARRHNWQVCVPWPIRYELADQVQRYLGLE